MVCLPTALDLAEYILADQHPATRRWALPEVRVKLLADEHQVDLDLSTDRTLATARRDRFAPQQPAELFLNSWTAIRPGLHVMLSMRYEMGNPAFPFVEVSAGSRPLNDVCDLRAAAVGAIERYGVLRPRYLRWWSSRPVGSFPCSGSLGKRFLAAPLDGLAGRPVPEQLALEPTRDLRHYDQAAAAYRSIALRHPDHPRQAVIEHAEALTILQRGGTLFDVLLDGCWVGYVAAQPGHTLGLAGYTIAELILTEAARGHGYGGFLTTMLARSLFGYGTSAILIGTIHERNTGALSGARLAGRHDIGGWVSVPL